MENCNDFEDFDFEALEQDILLVKKSLLKIEKNASEDIKFYFENIRLKVFLFNIFFLISFIVVTLIDPKISKNIIALPVINFIVIVYFDYRVFKNVQKLKEISNIEKIDLNVLQNKMNTTSLGYYSVISTFLTSIFFLCVLFNLNL